MNRWTIDHQALLPMGFSRQKYWSGLPFHSLGDLPDPRSSSGLLHYRWSPALQAYCLPSHQRFSGGASGKEPACPCSGHTRLGFRPWIREIPWRGNGNPLQCSYLENPTDRGAWEATILRAAELDRLNWLSTTNTMPSKNVRLKGVTRAGRLCTC